MSTPNPPTPPPTSTVSEPSSSRATTKPRLPPALKVSLYTLAALTVFVILTLFVDDVAGRGIKVFATVLYSAGFALFTILDMSIARKRPNWPLPLAVAGNAYMLGFGLVLVWVNLNQSWAAGGAGPYEYDSPSENVWVALVFAIPLILAVKGALLGSYWLNNIGQRSRSLSPLATLTAAGLVITSVTLTLPVLMTEALDIEPGSWYWKVVIAILMLTVLGGSSLAILSWYYRSNDPEYIAWRARRVQLADERARAHQEQHMPSAAPASVTPPQTHQKPPLDAWPRRADGTEVDRLEDGTPDFSQAWWRNLPSQPHE